VICQQSKDSHVCFSICCLGTWWLCLLFGNCIAISDLGDFDKHMTLTMFSWL